MNLLSCEECGAVMDLDNMTLTKEQANSYESFYVCFNCKHRLLIECRDEYNTKFNVLPQEECCPECGARKSYGHYINCRRKIK